MPIKSQTMTQLLARLRKEELDLSMASAKTEHGSEASKAFSSKGNPRKGGKAHKQGKPDEKAKPDRTGEKCSYCGKAGHSEDKCWLKAKCDKCGQIGHIAKFCRGPSGQAKANNAFMAQESLDANPRRIWYSDSGATQHITGCKSWYEEYAEFSNPRSVSLTNNQTVEALGMGTVRLEAFIDGTWISCTLSDVLYIPGAVNLFSEGVMAQKGYTIIRDAKGTQSLEDGRKPGPQAYSENQMYVMKFRASGSNAFHCHGNLSKLWQEDFLITRWCNWEI